MHNEHRKRRQRDDDKDSLSIQGSSQYAQMCVFTFTLVAISYCVKLVLKNTNTLREIVYFDKKSVKCPTALLVNRIHQML